MTVLRIPFLILMIHQAIITKGHYIGKLPPDITWQKSHNSEDFETWYKEEMVHDDDDTALWNVWVPEPPRNLAIPPPPVPMNPTEDLCSLLLHNLEILATDNSFNCQPMSSDVKGDIPEMCSQAAVEVVNTCKMQNQGSDCLRESLKGLNSSELLSTCLCHGYLDMYASLWTSWKLMCEGKTSLEANMKKKTRAIGPFALGDYWKKFNDASKDLLKEFNLMDRMMVRDTSVKPSTETIEWYQLSKCWWWCEEEYQLVDYHKDGDKRNNVHKVFVAKAAGSPPDVFYTSGYKGKNDARLHFGFLYMGGESQAFVFVIHPKSWYPYQHKFKTTTLVKWFQKALGAAAGAAAKAAAGAATTAAAGALIGAKAGSIVPVIGTVIGALVGVGVGAGVSLLADDVFGDFLRYIG